jgi:hypothetical protein
MIDYSSLGSLSVDRLRHSCFAMPLSTTRERGSSAQRSIGGGSSTLFDGISFNLSGIIFENAVVSRCRPASLVCPIHSSYRSVCGSYRNSLSLCAGQSRSGSVMGAPDEDSDRGKVSIVEHTITNMSHDHIFNFSYCQEATGGINVHDPSKSFTAIRRRLQLVVILIELLDFKTRS